MATAPPVAASHINVSQYDVQAVLKAVREVAQEVIGTEVDTNAPLMSIGIDSLSVMEFTNAIAARFSMDLAPTVLFDHPTVDSLAKFLSSELQSNKMISTTPTEDASTQREDQSRLLFIDPTAKQGIFVWRQKGVASKPAVIFLNGISGLAAGAELPRYLPNDVSIISIQAPDLLENFHVKNITKRAGFYLKMLISELDGHSRSMHLVGYSGGGPLAFEIALQAKTSTLKCKSLCLIDPTPYCQIPEATESYLMQRAKCYDLFSGFLHRKQTGFKQAVLSNDIRSVGQLEKHVTLAMSSESSASELSCIVDTAMKQAAELIARDISPRRNYAGLCAFLTAEPDYFIKAGMNEDDVHHTDGVYGWSVPLGCPGMKAIQLSCGHLNIFKTDEALRKVASTIISLLNTENIGEAWVRSSDP